MQTYASQVRRGLMSVRTLAYKSLKCLSRPLKRKRNAEMGRNWKTGAVQKDYHLN